MEQLTKVDDQEDDQSAIDFSKFETKSFNMLNPDVDLSLRILDNQ